MQESTLPRSLRANSLGRSGCGAGKWRRACKYVSGIEYLHRKSPCEMLIGGDGISNDVIALSTCLLMFVYLRARWHFVLIGGNVTAQSTGSRWGIGGGIQISENQLQALLPFAAPPPRPGHPGELARSWLVAPAYLLAHEKKWLITTKQK